MIEEIKRDRMKFSKIYNDFKLGTNLSNLESIHGGIKFQ